jgi:hypothetical protein
LDVFLVEEQMRDRWLGILLGLFVLSTPQVCMAEEIAGKLQRVGMHTVTVLRSDNQTMVVQVRRGQRREAAPYLGKSVMVNFRTEQGKCRAIGFRPPQK